jgi:hypothetical protein
MINWIEHAQLWVLAVMGAVISAITADAPRNGWRLAGHMGTGFLIAVTFSPAIVESVGITGMRAAGGVYAATALFGEVTVRALTNILRNPGLLMDLIRSIRGGGK